MVSVRHIVYECIPGSYAGGVQKLVFELASAQSRSGCDVEIWTIDAARAGSTEVHAGLPIRYFQPDFAFGYAKSARLVEAVRELPSSVILHAYNTFHPLNAQLSRAAGINGRRLFYSPQGALDPALLRGPSWKVFKKKAYISLFERPCFNRSSGIFALTPLEMEGLKQLGVRAPIHLVPNGVRSVEIGSLDAAAHFRRLLGIPCDARVLLFIGRINPKKRIEDIIVALKYTEQNARLVIAGNPCQEPAYHRHLLSVASRAGVSSRIHWAGFLDEASKPAAYASAEVFVHASFSEGMAIAILEAMSAGLPAVVTEGCYMGAAASAGALIQCGQSPEAISLEIRGLLADRARALSLGTAGRRYVSTAHDWDLIGKQMVRIYQAAD